MVYLERAVHVSDQYFNYRSFHYLDMWSCTPFVFFLITHYLIRDTYTCTVAPPTVVVVNSNLYVNRHSLDKIIYTIAGCIYPEADVDTQGNKTHSDQSSKQTSPKKLTKKQLLHPTKCLVHPTKYCSCGNELPERTICQVRNTAAVQKNVSAADWVHTNLASDVEPCRSRG